MGLGFKGKVFVAALLVLGFVGCSSSSTSPTASIDAADPSAVIGVFDTALSSAGSQLTTATSPTALTRRQKSNRELAAVESLCNENAEPLGESDDRMNSSDENYPYRVIFCKLVMNTGSPESIQGAYSSIQEISCALNAMGIVFDGVEHEGTIQLTSDCFADLSEMPTGGVTITYTASAPAAFNTFYDRGVRLNFPDFGIYTVAWKTTATGVEFMAAEDQTAYAANKTGVYAGAFDSSTGEIRFEGRHDRLNCSEEGSCGWSRHDRIYAKCGSVSSGECSSVESISAIASDIFSGSRRITTVSGPLSTGIKARYFQQEGSDFGNPAAWTEVTNSKCYTASTSSADCLLNTGIGLPSSTFTYPMHSDYTSTADYMATGGNLTFTSATFNDLP